MLHSHDSSFEFLTSEYYSDAESSHDHPPDGEADFEMSRNAVIILY